jgi:diguanylate cyclase (GGDEF)-like protein
MTTDYAPDRLRGRRAIPSQALLILLALVVVSFAVLCTRTLLAFKAGQWEVARGIGENIASAIEADITRNIEVYDLSLRNVVMNVGDPEVARLDLALQRLVLFDHAATAKYYGSIRVFDRRGNLTLDSGASDMDSSNCNTEEFFLVHQRQPNAGLFISPPVADRRGSYEIVLSRRISAADGSFDGVVVGSIKLSYFHDLFRRLEIHRDDALTVLSREGRVLMRRPFDLGMLGKNVGKNLKVSLVSKQESGFFQGVGAIDAIPRLYVWKAGPSCVVLVGRSLEQIYSAWWREALNIGGIMAFLLLIVLVITIVLMRETKLRLGLQRELTKLAGTDALTGLANRRTFDGSLERAWKLGSRTHSPISLMMIDADHFKRFNDLHGHPAGDAALRAIAQAISPTARRPEDCAARYGGEEFAVLLPVCDHADVLRLAEAIRASVQAFPEPALTLSIGVATHVPGPEMGAADLLRAADEALYAAKNAGRNRVCAAEQVSPPLAVSVHA